MAKVKHPKDPLGKRDILHKEAPDIARANAIAGDLIETGRGNEAVEYLEVTKSADLIERLAQKAMENGSTFQLQQVERLTGETRAESDWEQVIAKARQAERYLDVVRALGHIGREEEAESVRAEHCPDYDPFKPLGK